jgi:hypothetical protein
VAEIARQYGNKGVAPHTPKADPLIAPFWQVAALIPNLHGLRKFPPGIPAFSFKMAGSRSPKQAAWASSMMPAFGNPLRKLCKKQKSRLQNSIGAAVFREISIATSLLFPLLFI